MYQVPQIELPVHSSDEPQETRIRQLEEAVKEVKSSSGLKNLERHDEEHAFISNRMRELAEEGKDRRVIKRTVVAGLIMSGFGAVWALVGYGIKYWVNNNG